jgi:hypothetical protein
MGINLYSCSCFKNFDDIAIEVEFQSDKKKKIQILTEKKTFSLNKKGSIKNSSIGPNLSKIMSVKSNDSYLSDKNELKPLINNIKCPELFIQSTFRGYVYRKKFNEIEGIKSELIQKNNEKIKTIEKNFIPKIILKNEKLFKDSNFEENWKKFYDNKNLNELLPKKNNTYNNFGRKILVKTKCLLSSYKNEECLYKGYLSLNSLQKNKNKKRSYNINILTGNGILYLKKGKRYEGNFSNGELNGWCRYINTKGVCYEGLFIDNVLNGKGEIIKIDDNRRKNIYKGDIKNFKKEGKGKEKTSDYIYEGDFLNDMKHGHGKISYNNNGDFYEGQFCKGEITGKGFYKWKNKHTYFGDFFEGKMHGKGLYKWADGNQYEGEYINNIKEGQGEFRWKDGRIYKGTFENGKPHGKGLLTVKGITINAIFDNGRFLGDIQASINSAGNS